MGFAHLAQVGFFQPVLEAVRASGANVERLIGKVGLGRFDLNNANNYVPQRAVLSLLDQIKTQEGVDDFVAQFSDRVQIAQLANWGSTLSHRSNLLSACQFAARYGHVVLTNQRIKLEIIGQKAKVSLLFVDPPVSDLCLLEHVNFVYMYSTFCLAAGQETAPDQIHLQSHMAPNLDVLLPSGNNARILLGQPATALVFPAQFLSQPMLGLATGPAEHAFPEKPPGVVDSIASILDSWARDCLPNLVMIADSLDISARTLQRRIGEEGQTFSEVVDNWRFTRGIQMLSNSGMKICEVSQRLGYANPSNFDRAFRRWTGVSPHNFRESVRQA